MIKGNKPPGLVPNKFQYMTKDLKRLSEYFNVPLQPPADPFEAMFEKGKWLWSSQIRWYDHAWISHSGVLRLKLLPWLWKDFQLHFKVCAPLFALRLFVGDAICGGGARKGERRRQAGGAVVPGAVETDLERGQRHHWSRIVVWGANWSSPVVFEEINQQFGAQS